MTTDKKNQPENPEDSNVSKEERNLIDESIESNMLGDDIELRRARLENTDEDGELLNEESSADDLSGEYLDIPGAEADDADEKIGGEDEENNSYSVADTE